jgi:4-amino-4-deoxy-L-arabinose transferase-like glycosyltransferase
MVTGMFAFFGEKEWVARLVPIVCSLLSVVLLWLLVRDCLGARAATLSTLIFALQPMELYFGRMVNHEPCALMWMLAVLLSLRYWHTTGARWGLEISLLCLLLGMWTAWHVYIFALVVAGGLFAVGRSTERKAGLVMVALAVVSAVVFFLYVHSVRPDAWKDIGGAVSHRMSSTEVRGGAAFSSVQWLQKQTQVLVARICPFAWMLAVCRAMIVVRTRFARAENVNWLGWASLSLFLMNALYLIVFRNASYRHDYAGFYFVAPVAMMSGVALDAFFGWLQREDRGRLFRWFGFGAVMLVVMLLGRHAFVQLRALHNLRVSFSVGAVIEPENLIRDLGHAMFQTFPEETRVIYLARARGRRVYLGLKYYARHEIVYVKSDPIVLQEALLREGEHMAIVIWMGSAHTDELISALPEGDKRYEQFGALRFCMWKPYRRQSDQPGTGKSQ